jgi:hypothetical protein
MEKRRMFTEGQKLWGEYVNVNGYSFEPTNKGLKELSRMLDLNVKYLRERINIFLQA